MKKFNGKLTTVSVSVHFALRSLSLAMHACPLQYYGRAITYSIIIYYPTRHPFVQPLALKFQYARFLHCHQCRFQLSHLSIDYQSTKYDWSHVHPHTYPARSYPISQLLFFLAPFHFGTHYLTTPLVSPHPHSSFISHLILFLSTLFLFSYL